MRSLEFKFIGYFPNFDYYKSVILNGMNFGGKEDFPHFLCVQVFGIRYSTINALMGSPSRYNQYFPMKVREVLANKRTDLYPEDHFIPNYDFTVTTDDNFSNVSKIKQFHGTIPSVSSVSSTCSNYEVNSSPRSSDILGVNTSLSLTYQCNHRFESGSVRPHSQQLCSLSMELASLMPTNSLKSTIVTDCLPDQDLPAQFYSSLINPNHQIYFTFIQTLATSLTNDSVPTKNDHLNNFNSNSNSNSDSWLQQFLNNVSDSKISHNADNDKLKSNAKLKASAKLKSNINNLDKNLANNSNVINKSDNSYDFNLLPNYNYRIVGPVHNPYSSTPINIRTDLELLNPDLFQYFSDEDINGYLPENKPLFGYYNNPKFDRYSVFMSQENIGVVSYLYQSMDGYVDYVDLSTASWYPWQVVGKYNNYLHYPVYLTTIFTRMGMPTLCELREFVQEINSKRNADIFLRKYIVSLIATHDEVGGYKGVRQQLFDLVGQVFPHQPVYCPSKFNHNTDLLKTEFNDDKHKFLENFTFNICPENTYTPGYVTEKILDCLIAGCIPIYWGGIISESDIFNLDAILYYNPRQPRAFVECLTRFLDDEKFIYEFLQRPVFLPGAAERLFIRYYAPLLAKLERDIGLTTMYMRMNGRTPLPPNYHWRNDYEQAQQTLAALGLVEDKYTYLIDDINHQWPFSKSDKALVKSKVHLMHEQFPDQIVYDLGNYNHIPAKD